MLSSRLLKMLLGTTALLMILAAVLFYQQVPRRKNPFAAAADKADRIDLQQGPDKAELILQGKDWKVRTGQGEMLAPEGDRVKTLLSALRDFQVEDEIADRADRAADFEVTAASGTQVTLSARSETLADGIFGKQAPDFTHIYFRFADKPSVYLGRGIIRGELGGATVNAWRNHELINLPDAQIQSILIEGKGFKTDLERSSNTWTLNGESIDPGPVNGLVGILAHLRVGDFLDPARQPEMQYDHLTFARVKVKSGQAAVELRLGPQDPATHQYPAATSKDSGTAWISEAQEKAILRKPGDFRAPSK